MSNTLSIKITVNRKPTFDQETQRRNAQQGERENMTRKTKQKSL